MNKDKMDKYFMDIAELTAINSYAIRSKVGTVLVKDGRIICTGWNGTPYRFPNACEEERIDIATGEKTLVTLPYVIHAEMNVICFCAKNGINTDGTSLYITLSPCEKCALLLIQAGIKNVYYRTAYRDDTGLKILQKSSINVKQLNFN